MAGPPPGLPPGGPGMGAPPMMGGPPGGLPPRPGMKRGGRTRNMHDEWTEGEQHEKRGGRTEKRQLGGYTPMSPTPPMGAAPGMAGRPVGQPMMNRGGFALKDAGAGGAKGRMEKEKAYGHGGATHVRVKEHTRRKAGGRICD